MRVVVNQLAALGLKTGIGHYTVQLLRCLREQAGADQIDGFPEGWVRRVRKTLARVRPYLEGQTGATPVNTARPPSTTWRSRVLRGLRQFGRALMAQHFRMIYRLRGYQL